MEQSWSSQSANHVELSSESKIQRLCTMEQSWSSQSANHVELSSESKIQKVEPQHCSIHEDESTQHVKTGPSQRSSTENSTQGEMELQHPSQNNMFCHATEDENGKPETTTDHDMMPRKQFDKGLYITGRIKGTSVDFLIDSGADLTLISRKTFIRLQSKLQIDPEPTEYLITGVRGSNLAIDGQFVTSLTFGNTTQQPGLLLWLTYTKMQYWGMIFYLTLTINLTLVSEDKY